MKKILPLLALLCVPILSFAYNPANDSDGDSIENTTASGTILDRCPNTPANEIVDSMGCTAIQKQSDLDRDSTPDYLDSDIDGDSISNTDEIKGHTGAAGCFLSGIYIVTNQYSKDSDNDGLEDNNEGSKRIPLETTDENNRYQSSADVCGTSPIVSDTDQDRIPDVTDPCLTELELIPYIY
jgi:hypothetical protein